jgi:hypothetical protein
LEGSPKKVGKDFSCNRNKLVTLKGAPEQVNGWFICENQQGNYFTKKDVRDVTSVNGRIVI